MAHMEEVLDLYAEPYDPKRPVVCFDETSTQLLAETRAPMPPRPGRPLSLLKEFYSSTPSRYPAGHAQEPSRPNAPGRNSPSRNPKVTGRDLPPPGPRTQKPRGKRAGSTRDHDPEHPMISMIQIQTITPAPCVPPPCRRDGGPGRPLRRRRCRRPSRRPRPTAPRGSPWRRG